jgi:hypothetical protein
MMKTPRVGDSEWPSDHASVVVRVARDVNGRLTPR